MISDQIPLYSIKTPLKTGLRGVVFGGWATPFFGSSVAGKVGSDNFVAGGANRARDLLVGPDLSLPRFILLSPFLSLFFLLALFFG